MGDTHMRFIPMAAVLTVALATPSAVIGWGNEGHRIVGDIAWYYLSPEAKSEVLRLMPDSRTVLDATVGQL